MNESNAGAVASTEVLGVVPERAYVMAGTKEEGRGNAVFHAVHTSGNRYRISACGQAACGALVPIEQVPVDMRCRSAGCKAAFRLGA